MTTPGIRQLLTVIEQQLDWGDVAAWQSKDFENLNDLILEKTKVSLSASTLRRVWGRVEYNHLPSGTTLDTLARFAGYENWRTFTKQNHVGETPKADQHVNIPAKTNTHAKWRLGIALVVIVVIAVGLIGMYVKKPSVTPGKVSFSFSTHPVTRSIPNSVIFNYDVKTNPGDSVFIQQSWDNTTRVIVDPNRHQYTSIYYRPGFYHAKLGINNTVIKEQMLMIPTDGWLGLIAQQPIPVYLKSNEFLSPGAMEVPVSIINQKKIDMVPQPPTVEYYNVGNFSPVSLKDFSFETEIKNDYHEGAATCQYLRIILFTDNTPVIIPLSAPGCVSDLALLNGRYFEWGKNNDLSGFGADLSKWVKVSCKSQGKKILYYVNDKKVYESELPLYNENIIGLGYSFQGTGSVRGIKLDGHGKTVLKNF